MTVLNKLVEGQIALRPDHTTSAADAVSWTDELTTWDRVCAWWSWEGSMLVVLRTIPGTLFLSFLLSSVLLKQHLKASWSQEKVIWRRQQWNLQYSLRLPLRCSEVRPGRGWGASGEHSYKQRRQWCLWQLRGLGRKWRDHFLRI